MSVELVFDIEPKPYEKQAELLGTERFIVCEGGTKTGKTMATTLWQLQQMMGPKAGEVMESGRIANGRHVWFAQSHKVARIAFERAKVQLRPLFDQGLLRAVESPAKIIKGCKQLRGREWHFLQTRNVTDIYGDEWQSCVVEEFTRHRPGVWDAIETTLAPLEAPCRFIGNLTSKAHWGYRLARDAESGALGTEWRYVHISCYDAVAAGVISDKVVAESRRRAEKEGVLHIWERDWACRFTDADQPFPSSLLELCQAAPQTFGACALLLDAGGKGNPGGLVVLHMTMAPDGGMLLSVPYAEHFLGSLMEFEVRVDALVKQWRPSVITYDSYGGQLLERLEAKYPKAAVRVSKKDMLGGTKIAVEHMRAGRFAIDPDCEELLEDLDYIGMDGDEVTVAYRQKDYWHRGETIERKVHADAAVALLQGLGEAVARLTSSAAHGNVRVHGTPGGAAATVRKETTRDTVENAQRGTTRVRVGYDR